ncbi:MAG: translation initiation factor IF-3 [SAR202 cluster bacterium]|nr:translation initiation factor IF-3 [SAR202 cluster bacterium]
MPEVRVIDEKGKQLGVLPSGQAVQLAESKGLDLVEVSDNSVPPVCRIMDYGKFRYQLTRRERNSKKEHKASSVPDTKEVRFKTRIGEHDRQSKARQVSRMLKQGAKVKISVMFRGREITHPEIGMNLLRSVAEDLADDAMLEKPPGFEGRFLSMVLAPQKSGSAGSKNTKGVKEVAKDKNT